MFKNQKYIDSFIEEISYPIYYKDKNCRYLGCNRHFEEFFGKQKIDIIGKMVRDIACHDFAEADSKKDIDLLEKRGSQTSEYSIMNENNNVKNVIISKVVFEGIGKGFVLLFGIIFDITERKNTEIMLKMLSRAMEQSPASVVITDIKGNIEYINPKFSRLTGYTFEEVRGNNPRVLKSGIQSPEFYKELWDTITSGKEWRGEFHNKKKNNELYWEYASISPILDENGKVTHFVAVKEDVTERKKAEEALRISEEKLRKRNMAMQKDLEIARITHRALIVKDVPKFKFLKMDYRYSPLDEIGGDYFSFMQHNNNGMGIFICDVAGHGVVSALFLALIKFASEKIFKGYGNSPSKYLENLNLELIGNMSSYYITGIYGLFEFSEDGKDKILKFANGGHPFPVLIKREGAAEFVGDSNTIIGFFEEAKYEEMIIKVDTGDRIFLYTDGIPETENKRKERIGIDKNLLDIFERSNVPSLGETLDNIILEADRFRNDSPVIDDILLIGIEIL